MIDRFPLLYEAWYAARLFFGAGLAQGEILRRIGLDAEQWTRCDGIYSKLHYANTPWVHSAFERDGLPSPEDPALLAHLTSGGVVALPAHDVTLDLRAQLKALRRKIEANPRIGPFADVDWIAVFVGERSFPPTRYVHDGRFVRVEGRPLWGRNGETIEGIDPHSFEMLGDRWFRDNKRVYCQAETPRIFFIVMRGADPDSFEVLNERYAHDRAAGYYSTGRRLPTEEPGTFEIVSYYYGRGQKPGLHVKESHYAKDSRKVYGYGRTIEGAHAPSFQSIGDEGVYFTDANRVYHQVHPIEGADRESFTCASEQGQYRAFDKNRSYYAGTPLSIAKSFDDWTDFFNAHPELTNTWWHRERDRRQTRGADGEHTLTPLGGPYFSDGGRILVRLRDRRRGESPWVSLDHLDLASFRHLVDQFAEDRAGLRYFTPGAERYGRDAVKSGDPSTFVALGDHWYRDQRQVYYFDTDDLWPELATVKADLPSFELLGGAYARDAKGLIYAGVRKRDIPDASDVVSLGFAHARIGGTILFRGKVVSKSGALDIETAKALSDTLLIDRGGHMLLGSRYRKPIAGLDIQSLQPLNRRFWIDESRVYLLTDTSLGICELADRASVEPAMFDSIRDKDGRIVVDASGRIKRVTEDGN